VVLQTNRLERMRDWYRTVLGAHVVYENPGMCFLTFDEEHHRLALVASPGEPFVERTPLTVGLQHSAFTFPDLASLLAKFTELRGHGIEPLVPIQHGVTTSLYYRDPDGNTVELQIDNFADPDDATAYMTGPEYAADPIGPTFDPVAMADALHSGTDPAELTTRAWAHRAGPPVADPMLALLGS
jgi:catechol-2,3-dioxygenase